MKPIRFRWRNDIYEFNPRCFLNWRCPLGGFLFVVVVVNAAYRLGWDKTFLEYPAASAIALLLAMHALKNLRVCLKAARLGHRRAAFCCGLLTLAYLIFFAVMAPLPLPKTFQADHFYQLWLAAGFALAVGGLFVGRRAFAASCPQTVSLN